MLDPAHDIRDAVIVGAGLAGLACALELHARGVAFTLLEASDAPGGRLRTDVVDGFRLDRGLHALLTASPEAGRVLDYGALDLRPLGRALIVRQNGRFARLADPLRRPGEALDAADGAKLTDLIASITAGPLERVLDEPEVESIESLHGRGFSDAAVEGFFRPLLGAMFLDRDLRTSSRMMRFALRMLAEGDAAIPAKGIGEIPAHLAVRLPAGALRTNARVDRIDSGAVTLATGEIVRARQVVVATEGPEACRLLGDALPPVESHSAVCMHFAAEASPVDEPALVLAGESADAGPVGALFVPSLVSPACAPAGAHLVSVMVIGNPSLPDADLDRAVRAQLNGWFGPIVSHWRCLRTLRVAHAQPALTPPAIDPHVRASRVRPGMHAVGDHRATATIDGALRSGRLGAEAVAHDLGLS